MLFDQIKADLTTAMKSGESLKVSVLRMLLSEINYKKIDLQREVDDTDIIGVIGREAKKRKEAIESYTNGDRTEQAELEKTELGLLQKYLPPLMTEDEVKAELNKLNLPNDFGQAMRLVSPLFKGRADGSMIARLVKEMIGNG